MQIELLTRESAINVYWENEPGAKPSSIPFDSDLLAQYAPSFVAEIRKYPVDFFRSVDVQRFVLCRRLPRDALRRAFVTDHSTRTIRLDVAAGLRNQRDLQLAIHHAIFMSLKNVSDRAESDTAWISLNSEGFQYQAKSLENTQHPLGFVSRFAKVSAANDQAEIFAYCMVQPEVLRARVADDSTVAKKLQHLRNIVERDFPGLSLPGLQPIADSPVEHKSELKPVLPASELPQTWPRFIRALGHGDHEVRIRNPNPTLVKIGLRNNGDGVDFDVAAGESFSVRVPSGTYKMYFWYANRPDEVMEGNEVQLTEPGRGVQIELVRSVGGNYGLKPVSK